MLSDDLTVIYLNKLPLNCFSFATIILLFFYDSSIVICAYLNPVGTGKVICSIKSILLVAFVCDTHSGTTLVPDQMEKNMVSIVHFRDYAVSEVVYRNLFQLLPYLDF